MSQPPLLDREPPPPPPFFPEPPPAQWLSVAPPPANANQRWAPALAIGLVLVLVAATAAGSLLVTRAISSGFPNHALATTPSIFPGTSVPAQSPGVPSQTALLTVLTAAPETPGVIVDPALAARVLDTLWPVREQALDANDLVTLAGFETGSALQGDTADNIAAACGCPDPLPRPIATQNLFVPKQTTYPAWFITELTTSPVEGSPPDVSLMVLTRASAATHWMVSLETGYSFAAGSTAWVYATPEAMASGFDLPTPTHNELPGDLQSYYQHWADHGAAPPSSPLAPGVFTSAIGQEQVTLQNTLAGQGQVHRVVYSIDLTPDGVWSVSANNVREQPTFGWALTCGTVRYEAVTTLAKGAAVMVQRTDLATWGPTLPAGTYTRITQWGLHESCFLDDQRGIPYIVLGHNGGVIRSTGVPAA